MLPAKGLKKYLVSLFVFGIVFCFFLPLSSLAITREECQRRLENDEGMGLEELEECEQIFSSLLNEAKKQEKSLESEINRFNREINLTNTQISQTVEKISLLDKEIVNLQTRIYHLDLSLNEISALLIKRVEETYKKGRVDPLFLLLSSRDFAHFVSRLKYFQVVQRHDKKLLFQVQEAKLNYQEQKDVKEEKQVEQEELKDKLAYQNKVLGQQKQSQETFLRVTRNDKERYDQLREEARREAQAVLTSQFAEKKHVARGETIGLMGSTGFSTGPHLHFGVYNLSESEAGSFDYFSRVEDPVAFLASKSVLFEATACDDTPQSVTKAIGSGSWSWPMANPRITQCFGHTPWSWRYSGNFHHGLDMADKSNVQVRSVEEGEAYFYRGQSSFGNNVRVFHPNGKMTLYLHLQ